MNFRITTRLITYPTQRRETSPTAEQNHGDREDGCQPDQRGAALSIGVRIAESGIRTLLSTTGRRDRRG